MLVKRSVTRGTVNQSRPIEAEIAWPACRACRTKPMRIHRPAEYVHHHLHIRRTSWKLSNFLRRQLAFPQAINSRRSPECLPPFCQTAAHIVSFSFNSLKNAGPLGTLNFKACFPAPTTNRHADIYSWRKHERCNFFTFFFAEISTDSVRIFHRHVLFRAQRDEGHDWCFS